MLCSCHSVKTLFRDYGLSCFVFFFIMGILFPEEENKIYFTV